MRVVLVVEDDELQANLMSSVLNRMNCDVVHTVYGSRAIEIAKERQPELILLDLTLPDMHGLNVIEQLKEDSRTEAIPIIVVTGSEFGADKSLAWAAGCEGYIHKPFKIGDLRDYLAAFFELLSEKEDPENNSV